MDYAMHMGDATQVEKADPRQEKNNAGGYSFVLDKWKRLERFLILGADGGTYYVTERKLARDNAVCVSECLAENHTRAVDVIASISESGRAPKNEAAVFALAIAASHENSQARAYALAQLGRVCRIGTHIFQFVAAVDAMRGWGRSLRRAVASWYESQEPSSLAYGMLKYQQRNGWSHRDVLRLVHPSPSPERNATYRWAATRGHIEGGEREVKRGEVVSKYAAPGDLPAILAAYDEMKRCTDAKRAAEIVRAHRMTHEMVPASLKAHVEVWHALAEHMPLGALIRNLAKLTAVGVIAPLSEQSKSIAARIADADALKHARIHPIGALSALKVYQQGHGERGKLTWSPNHQVVEALNAAFYACFAGVQSTGKATLIALDVSGSMDGAQAAGIPGLTARDVSAAMAMVTMRTEPNWHAVGFSNQLVDVPITPSQRLDDVIRTMRNIPMGGTDCALPMNFALERKLPVDVFQVYTDNETWHGAVHPHVALRNYRERMQRPAKLAVLGVSASEFTVADPSDAGMMDFVGFDSSAPAVLADWARG